MKNNYTKEQAIQYSEGNEILKEILFLCLEKDIETIGCCAGHYCMTWEKRKEYLQEHYNMNYRATIVDTEEKWLEIRKHHSNQIPYIAFGKGEDEKNFCSYLIQCRGNKKERFLIAFYCEDWGIGFTVRWQDFKEKDEKIFHQEVNEFFEWILKSMREFDKNKKYEFNREKLVKGQDCIVDYVKDDIIYEK